MPLLVGTAIQNLPMACRHNISIVIKIGQNHDLAARANGAGLCRFKHAKPFAERDLLVVADRLVGKDQDRWRWCAASTTCQESSSISALVDTCQAGNKGR